MEQIIKADRGRMSRTLRKMQSSRQAIGGLIPPLYPVLLFFYSNALMIKLKFNFFRTWSNDLSFVIFLVLL